MASKTEELEELNAELVVVQDSIKNIMQSGQGFRKGGFSGFSVDQAKLSELRAERTEIRNKIAFWELSE